VLVSAVLKPDGVPGNALDEIINTGVILYSGHTFHELSQTLKKDKLKSFFSEDTAEAFLKSFLLIAEEVTIEHKITACRDPKDNKFLELAISGQADFIISGDQDLLVFHPFESIPVISPADFLNLDS
jgi:putative PIN family toxin of toxin-antitoxin system